MVFLNESGIIGQLIVYATRYVTGSEFMTYFLIFLIFIMFGLLFRLPLELTFTYTLPLLLLFTLMSANFSPLLGLISLYLAFYLAKTFIAK